MSHDAVLDAIFKRRTNGKRLTKTDGMQNAVKVKLRRLINDMMMTTRMVIWFYFLIIA